MKPKNLLPIASITILFLAACGPNGANSTVGETKPPAATPIASIVLSGPGNGKAMINVATPLQVSLLDSAGATITGKQVTWTSSDAAIATVDAGGVVTAKRIGDVTVTAEAEGKKSTSKLGTYGLEIVGGTRMTAAGVNGNLAESLGSAFSWRLIDAAGLRVITGSSGKITEPSGGASYELLIGNTGFGSDRSAPKTGIYTAEIQSGGTKYTNSFSIDPTRKLNFTTNIQVSNVTTTSASVTWNSVVDAKEYLLGLCGNGASGVGNVNSGVVKFDPPLVRGQSYKLCIDAWNYNSNLLPDQVLQSVNAAGFLMP
jgi:Bacterial Ig-like domain (group 2)